VKARILPVTGLPILVTWTGFAPSVAAGCPGIVTETASGSPLLKRWIVSPSPVVTVRAGPGTVAALQPPKAGPQGA